jgi:hypothetical protein
MSKYSAYHEWQNAIDEDQEPMRELNADNFEDAKIEAALLFALDPFKGTPPTGYVIRQNGRTEVYRYPERAPVAGAAPYP